MLHLGHPSELHSPNDRGAGFAPPRTWLAHRAVVFATLSLLSLALPSTLLGCAEDARSEPAQAAVDTFPVGSPRVEDTIVERAYVAEIQAVRYAEVRARIKGILEKVAVDEGQTVKDGDLLFTINARDLSQEVAAARAATLGAEAELQAAEVEVENTKLLFDKNVVAAAELALAQARVDALKAKVDEGRASAGRAAVELGYARVTAPFAGVVNRIPNKAGSAISEEALLTTVADTSEVFAYFRVSEQEYLQYNAKTNAGTPEEVWLELVDGSRFDAPGVIDAVENEFDRDTGSIAFRAKFPNADGVLKHGSGGKVIVKTRLPGALLIPQPSTFEVQGDLFVYVVDADGLAQARKIQPKVRAGEYFVLESGLELTDRFVLEGVQKIRDGAKIAVAPEQVREEG